MLYQISNGCVFNRVHAKYIKPYSLKNLEEGDVVNTSNNTNNTPQSDTDTHYNNKDSPDRNSQEVHNKAPESQPES